MSAAPDDRYRLSQPQARQLAEQFGTPLYVLDESHYRNRIRTYLAAFRAAYPKTELSFASKANSTLAVLAIAHQEGCGIDVASEGELRAALKAGVPAKDCTFHGNNKSRAEIAFAMEQGIGAIVIDHFHEIDTVAELIGGSTQIVLRLAPGVDPVTHHKISTGQADTKFGFNIADGSAERATRECLDKGLPLKGFHCHVGSQLLDPEAQRAGGELIARFALEVGEKLGFKATYLNLGGGLGVRYTLDDHPTPLAEYFQLLVDSVRDVLGGIEPVLGQEPGRALVAESGVTLYTVGVVKTVPIDEHETRTYVAVDGGYTDNPRPSLYGAAYEVHRIAKRHNDEEVGTGAITLMEHGGMMPLIASAGAHCPDDAPPMTCTVSGKNCETDMLFPDVELPCDTGPGDLLQVLCTGAYNSSMASNYNRYPRPATVLIRPDGKFFLAQRRESFDEMLSREALPEDF